MNPRWLLVIIPATVAATAYAGAVWLVSRLP